VCRGRERQGWANREFEGFVVVVFETIDIKKSESVCWMRSRVSG